MLCCALFPPLRCTLGASCRCRLLGALFVLGASVLCCWSALVGRLSGLECAFWGFPRLLALLHLFPLLRLFVTNAQWEPTRYMRTISVVAGIVWQLLVC